MKTQGEVEAAVCDGVKRLEQQYAGRGPSDIHAYLIGDLLLVRMKDVLTAVEHHLVNEPSIEKGKELLKQLRIQLFEAARPAMEQMVQEATGVKLLSLHHDISTRTGEELVIFTLEAAPTFRESREKTDRPSGPSSINFDRESDGKRRSDPPGDLLQKCA